MKKIKYLLLMLVSLFICNVKADMGGPSVISYKAMITNQNGAQCYDDIKGTKNEKIIPYKTVFEIFDEMDNGYIWVNSNEYSCYVKTSDLGAMDKNFDLNNEQVTKIEPVKAIILTQSGLNMRRGPATSYSRITTIPGNAIVTLKYKAGTYWYYVEYKGMSGWITGMNGYFGMDASEILFTEKAIDIYNSNKKKIGTIPANTEITNYLKLVTYLDDYSYYVVYNNVRGYIFNYPWYKVEPTGKIRLLRDYDIKDSKGNLVRKMTKGKELSYDYINGNPWIETAVLTKEKNVYTTINEFDMEDGKAFEYITEGKIKVKESGYIGNGLFGEEKIEQSSEQVKENEPIKEETTTSSKKFNTQDIVIICLLAGILIALVALVCIKIANKKNKNIVVTQYKVIDKAGNDIDTSLEKKEIEEKSEEVENNFYRMENEDVHSNNSEKAEENEEENKE